ncbi:hypothetical protein D9757_001992 [Collybiopsis confluens]|uniref:Uncharacterized protein n=1 Tax=Collybiopsis confluens TaxID=2823264 RepID=A0A8H5HXT4_9AGAR|nr:hypothetical protein D9757_001992 [Collybiopsis confluens]
MSTIGAHSISFEALPGVVRVDSYVIFVGAFTLLTTFTLEVGRGRNAFTSQVWIDCTISILLFLLNLSSASVVTALLPSQMCSGDQQLPSGACTSTIILESFTWIYSIILLTYFLTIFITVFVRSTDSKLWGRSVYQLGSYETNSGSRLRSPSSPIPSMLYRFIKPPSIAAPRPRRVANAVPDLIPYGYRSGLGPDYQIEHFQLPAGSESLHQALTKPPPIAGSGPLNLYPEFLRSSLQPTAQPASRRNSSALPGAVPPQMKQPSPPPLGNWPRSDIMQQTSRRSTRRIAPRVAAPLGHHDVVDPQEMMPGTSRQVSMSISRSRPSGPRTRTGSNSEGDPRPPPLDLSSISSLRPNR